MGNDTACLTVGEAPADRLHHVEVVHDVVKTAIIGKAIEQRSNGVFGRHKVSSGKNASSIRPAPWFSQVLDQTRWDSFSSHINDRRSPAAAQIASGRLVQRLLGRIR